MKNSISSATPETPLIFDIQHGSTVDGPGVRTVVFFKGCNLNCYWCHNPEGKSPLREGAFFKERCVGCRVCEKVCSKPVCDLCGECAALCLGGARRVYGREYTVEELTAVIVRDRSVYDMTGGGVTFSGGECMLYPGFVSRLAEKCRENSVSVAIDTAGNVPYASFERVLPFVDLFLYDIKAVTPGLHRKGTGCGNSLILENLTKLAASGKDIIIRVPVIPGFNDGAELEFINAYISKLGLAAEYLPFHAMGESKKAALCDFSGVIRCGG